jgi:hypothetical protein
MSEYNKVWSSMNELEAIVTKFTYIKDLSECVYDAAEHHDWDKIQSLTSIISEYTQFVLNDWDVAFATAWSETVSKMKDVQLSCDGNDLSPECKGAWDSFWEQNK